MFSASLLPVPGFPLDAFIRNACQSQVLDYTNAIRVFTVIFTTIFTVPIIVTTAISIHIFVIAVRQSRIRATQNKIQDQNERAQVQIRQRFADLRRFNMSLGVICVSYIGWLPRITSSLLVSLGGIVLDVSLYSSIGLLAVASCWLQVVALAQTNTNFKKALLHVFEQTLSLFRNRT